MTPKNFAFGPVSEYARASDDETASWQLNPALAKGKPLSDRQSKVVKGLDKAAKPLSKDTTLWRGHDKDLIKHNKPVKPYVSATESPGEAYDYLSIPAHKDEPTKGVMYKIHVPKGTPTIKVSEDKNTGASKEEHILPRNSVFSRGKSYPHPDNPKVKIVELEHKAIKDK